MASLSEIVGGLSGRMPDTKPVGIAVRAIGVGGLVLTGIAMMAGGIEIGDPNAQTTSNPDGQMPAGLSLKTPEPTRGAKSLETPNVRTVQFNGIDYATQPSSNFPLNCATSYVSRALTSDQLRLLGIKSGDVLYMKNGQGVGDNRLGWGCKDGKRVINPAPPLKPGPRTWH